MIASAPLSPISEKGVAANTQGTSSDVASRNRGAAAPIGHASVGDIVVDDQAPWNRGVAGGETVEAVIVRNAHWTARTASGEVATQSAGNDQRRSVTAEVGDIDIAQHIHLIEGENVEHAWQVIAIGEANITVNRSRSRTGNLRSSGEGRAAAAVAVGD